MNRTIRARSLNAFRGYRQVTQSKEYFGLPKPTNEYKDTFARHRNLMPILDKRPVVADDCFVAPNAKVWYGAVIRGNQSNLIGVGFKTSVQDNVVIHCVNELTSGFPADVLIGQHCTIGQGAVLTSCMIADDCVIGQGAIIPEGCVIESGCMIADGAVLAPYTHVPTKQVWAGNPAKFIREVSEEEIDMWRRQADRNHKLAQEHKGEFFNGEFCTSYKALEALPKTE